jgi:hypothetical protein
MKLRDFNYRHSPSLQAPPITGAWVVGSSLQPWLPSTWPLCPSTVTNAFIETLGKIFKHGMLDEIDNVIEDAMARNGSLEHRGHVIAIAIMCAVDTVASFTSQDTSRDADLQETAGQEAGLELGECREAEVDHEPDLQTRAAPRTNSYGRRTGWTAHESCRACPV